MGVCNSKTDAETGDSKKVSNEKSKNELRKSDDGDGCVSTVKAGKGDGKTKRELQALPSSTASNDSKSESSTSNNNPLVEKNEPPQAPLSTDAESTTSSSSGESSVEKSSRKKYFQAHYEILRQVPYFREIQKNSLHFLCIYWNTLKAIRKNASPLGSEGCQVFGEKVNSRYGVNHLSLGVLGSKHLATSSHWCKEDLMEYLGCENRKQLLETVNDKIKGMNKKSLEGELTHLRGTGQKWVQIDGSGVKLFAVFCKTMGDFEKLSNLLGVLRRERQKELDFFQVQILLVEFMLDGIGEDPASQTVFPINQIIPSNEKYWDIQKPAPEIRTSDIMDSRSFPGLIRTKMVWNTFGTDMMFLQLAEEIKNDGVLLHLKIPIIDPHLSVESVFLLPRKLPSVKRVHHKFFPNSIFDEKERKKQEYIQFCDDRCFLEKGDGQIISKDQRTIRRRRSALKYAEGKPIKKYLHRPSSSQSLEGVAMEPQMKIDNEKRVSKFTKFKTKKAITSSIPSIHSDNVESQSKKVDMSLPESNDIEYEKISSLQELEDLLQWKKGEICPLVFGRSCKTIKVSYEIQKPLSSLNEKQLTNISTHFYRSKSENELDFATEIDERHSPKKCSRQNVTDLINGGVRKFLEKEEAEKMGFKGDLQKFTKLYDPMPYRNHRTPPKGYYNDDALNADLRSYQCFHHFSLVSSPGLSGSPVGAVVNTNDMENSILESIHTTLGSLSKSLHVPLFFMKKFTREDSVEKNTPAEFMFCNLYDINGGSAFLSPANAMKVYVESPKFFTSVSSFQCFANSEMYLNHIASDTKSLLTGLAKANSSYSDAFSVKLQLFNKWVVPSLLRKAEQQAKEREEELVKKLKELEMKLEEKEKN